jgi:hypothetical protein
VKLGTSSAGNAAGARATVVAGPVLDAEGEAVPVLIESGGGSIGNGCQLASGFHSVLVVSRMAFDPSTSIGRLTRPPQLN